jgi:hypothetical protein
MSLVADADQGGSPRSASFFGGVSGAEGRRRDLEEASTAGIRTPLPAEAGR